MHKSTGLFFESWCHIADAVQRLQRSIGVFIHAFGCSGRFFLAYMHGCSGHCVLAIRIQMLLWLQRQQGKHGSSLQHLM